MSALRATEARYPQHDFAATGVSELAPTPPSFAPAPLARAIAELRAGRAVRLVAPGESALIAAAQMATPALIASLERLSGMPSCLAVPHGTFRDRPQMTGISSLGSPASRAFAVQQALHGSNGLHGTINVLEADRGGVLARAGLPEGATALVRLAGLGFAALVLEVDRGRAGVPRIGIATLPAISIDDVRIECTIRERRVERAAEIELPTLHGRLRAVGYGVAGHEDVEFMALIHGDVIGRHQVPVAVHEGCLLGDALGALSCGCGTDLRRAMDNLTRRSCGILIRLQAGAETFFHTERAPEPASVGYAVQVLADLGPSSAVVVDTAEPLRRALLEHCGPFAR